MNTRPSRIVVVPSRYPYGSQEAYLGTELSELIKYVEHIAVVPLRPPASVIVQRVPPGVEVIAWPFAGVDVLRRAFRAVRARPREAWRAVADLTRSRDPGRTKNLVVILKALALADLVMERGYDHIHAYWISAPATLAYIASAVSGVAWSATAHRWDIYERNAFDVKERSAAFIRTISDRGTSDIGARMPSLAHRIVQLRLGTDVPPAPRGTVSRDHAFRIVCPAALVAVKGHLDLFAALALLRDDGIPVQCTLAGTGPLRESLEQRARAMRLGEVVTFTGLVPQNTLHAWYRAGRFAAVVLASRNQGETVMEGLPSALIEAMAFGVPVVATDSGSIGELLDDRCGRLVVAGDPSALAHALRNVYYDPAAARERARRAYDLVAAQHDVRVQMRAFAAVLAGSGSTP